MAISFIAYMPFIIAQLYPRSYTLIPSGLAVGFGKSTINQLVDFVFIEISRVILRQIHSLFIFKMYVE